VCRCHRRSSGRHRSGIYLAHQDCVRRSTRDLVGRLYPPTAACEYVSTAQTD
jgi:hypothetical protein